MDRLMVASYRELLEIVTTPQRFLAERLTEPQDPRVLLLTFVVPLAAVRAGAVLLRSVFAGSFFAGLLLAIGSFLLLIGTWIAVSLIAPTLAKQLNVSLDERAAFSLLAYASVPLWLAGIFYVVPSDPPLIFVWSRLAVLLVASYGLYMLYLGLGAVNVEERLRPPLLGLLGVTYFLVYGLLFAALGVTMWIVLFAVG